ncbi:PREDICTED: FK506-binding protein 5-like [Vollenhovia emeryi]|uniref:FK506-binding protein 5-like n=1 Tax=Vollenhovia emeryi TaxID=411798 RepID=UPI0005F450BB|nr:PREDICTED: FK506-binding protein 5-like [Vollenhovia emeryi]
MPRCRRGATAPRGQVLLLRLLLLCALVAAARQEETARSWDKLSQLIPTNSVYGKQDRNASPSSNGADASLAHSLAESNVMDTSKSKEGGDGEEVEQEEEEEEEEEGVVEKEPKLTYDSEEYEDEDKREEEEVEEEEEVVEEVEEEKKDPSDTTNGATKKERSPPETSSVSNIEAIDISKDGDYLEDLPTNSDDNTYYYYDDYENGNRSRYDGGGDGGHLDYVDTESEEDQDITPGNTSSESEHGVLEKRDKDASHESTSNSSQIVEETNPISSTELEQGSSMESSDKTFTTLSAPLLEEQEEPENVSAEVSSILIGGAVVSVVTTKSVVNGTIAVPTTVSPATTEQVVPPPPPSSSSSSSSLSSSLTDTTEEHPEVTTEDSARILASVQTSRSVSGARFLPFPVIDRVEQVEAHSGSLDSKKTSQPPSTESIIDKLDWAQSKLSSDLLPAAILGTGGFRSAGNTLQLDVLAERDRTTTTTTTRRSFTSTAKTPVISKFIPRRYNDKRLDHSSTSTAKPRFETVVDTLEGLLPRNYVSRGTTPSAVSKTNFRLDMLRYFLKGSKMYICKYNISHFS